MNSIFNNMYRIVLFSLFINVFLCQDNTLLAQQIPESVRNYIEDYYSIQSDSPEEVDVNIIFDQLTYYLEQPLSINQANRNELQELQLLTTLQVDALLNYRKEFGELVNIYELQAIPNFDIPTIRRLEPFITLGRVSPWTQRSLKKNLSYGQGSYYLRYGQILEEPRGFRAEEGEEPAFEGSPGSVFSRIQYRLPKRFSVGITAEKDAGEAFFKGSNPQGFDYYTAHIFVEDPTPWINRVAIGDYNLSLGQGLILHSGFGGGKSAFTTNIKKGGYSIRPHTSIAENTFLRGAASEFTISPKWSALLFYSNRKIDGNIAQTLDTLDNLEPGLVFTSINNSGFHRTQSEIGNENALNDTKLGGRIGYESDRFEVHFNYFAEKFSAPLDRRDDLYNLFVPEKEFYQFASLDYSWIGKSWHLFGETAYNGSGISTLNGVLSSPVRTLQIALMHRYFQAEYFSLNANAFGEVQQASNENGLYVGLNWHVSGPFHLSAYADVWKHPWLRFNVDAPSRGSEYMLRLQFYKKRQFDAYIQLRSKTRWVNLRADNENAARVLPQERMQLRLHISQQLNKDIELRYRAEWIRSAQLDAGKENGYLLYADVIYKPIGFPVSFTSRFALYDSDSYSARLYAYENNLLYSFSIPAYFGKGTRGYLNVRWKVFRNLTWEARYARTWRFGAESIGSGFNEIAGDKRTELATQIKLTF